MPLYQRTKEDGIEFVNQHGETVAGIKDDGTIWGKFSAGDTAAGTAGPKGDKGDPGEPGIDGAGLQPQALSITPPKDLASTVAAVRAIISVLHDAGITV